VGVPDAFTDKYLLGVLFQNCSCPSRCFNPLRAGLAHCRLPRSPLDIATVLGLGFALIAFVADWLITFVLQLAFPASNSALQNRDTFKPTNGPGFPTLSLYP